MRKNKKAFIAIVVIVLTVLVVGAITTTYAWFLSRYSHEYEVVLRSQSTVIIKYESELQYASGNISSSQNVLTPATALLSVGIQQAALEPIDVFDTTKVQTAANTVKFTASGAYWTGESETVGDFRPELHAFLSTYATAQHLSEHTVIAALDAERTAVSKPLTHNDLVAQGEVGFFMVIDYQNKKFLYYDGAFFVSGAQSGSAFTFPVAAESNNNLRYWHTPTAQNSTVGSVQLSDGDHLYLQPNTTFSYTLYAFMALTDEELAYSVNGQRITLFATMRLL